MIEQTGWLIAWGVVVGLDLASVAQTMVSRPFVAGTVAGIIAGDPTAGMTVGVLLELFALDVLPFGAVRYPDYGLGAVAATMVAAGVPSIFGTGTGLGVGLVVAYIGGVGIHLVRVLNAHDVDRHRALLDIGNPRAVMLVHLRGLGRDALRAAAVTSLGWLLAMAIRHWAPISLHGAVYIGIAAVGAALAAAVSGVARIARQRVALIWFTIGLGAGILGAGLL